MNPRRVAAAATLILFAQAGAPHAADPKALETVVKATYLYKFESFVQWPGSAFPSPTSPFVLCIAGDDAFADAVGNAVSGQHVGARNFEVKRVATASRDTDCHVLYLAGSGTQPVADALEAVRGAPVLTVTDGVAGGRLSGIIDFVVQDNRVRFVVDDGAASASGMTLSSELLKLALSVKPRS